MGPHVGQVGHAILIAPTESGKTTFVNFCLSQFQKYGDVNTFIFDRDQSVKITTFLHGENTSTTGRARCE